MNEIIPFSILEIPRFPGYAFSGSGHVLSCWDRMGGGRGYGTEAFISEDWHVLTPQENDGYMSVTVAGKPYRVHRLVLEAFIGPCPANMEGCHGDGNRGNNSIPNLRWDTKLENAQDRIKHGTQIKGAKHHKAIHTDAQIEEIKTLSKIVDENGKSKYSQRTLAKMYDTTQATISRYLSGKRRNT
jgi:hypothetical protein